jgi:hypothetical protein
MTHCKQPGCKLAPYHGLLCYLHRKLSQGFVFDPEQKLFVRPNCGPANGRASA